MKTFKFGLLIGIMAVLSSCGNNNPPPPEPRPSNNKTFVFNLGKAVFYGDLYHNGSNVFDVYLLDKGLNIDDKSYIYGTGYFLYLDLNTPNNSPTIPNGTYNVATNGSNFTFQKGSFYTNTEKLNRPEGSFIAKVQDDHAVEFYLIDKGTMSISGDKSYIIQGQAISVDDIKLNFTFNGNINLVDRVTPLPENLTKGELWYFGNRYNNGLNVFSINLGDQNTDMSKMTGGADMMQIEVYTPLNYNTGIPDGVYPVRIDNAAPKSVIDGYTENNILWGTWYFTETDYKITQGSLNVSHKTSNTYTLSFDFKDEYNRSIIRPAFDISLGYYDKTLQASGIKQMMRTKAAQQRTPVPKDMINIRERVERTK